MRVSPTFDDKETAILIAIYDDANHTHTSYTLGWRLNPTVVMDTPPAGIAFAETQDATERLIDRGLVSGRERHTGADGVYFNKLKLTAKAVRTAIQQRNTAKDKKVSAEKTKELTEKIEKLMGGKE